MKEVLAAIDRLASYLEEQPLYQAEASALADVFLRIAKKHEVESRHRKHHGKRKDGVSNPPPQDLMVGPDGNFTGGDFGDGGSGGGGAGGGGAGASSKQKMLTAAPMKFRRSPVIEPRTPENRRVAEFDAFFGRQAAESIEESKPISQDVEPEVNVDEIDLVHGDDSIFGDSKKKINAPLRQILGKFPKSALDLTNSDETADIVPVPHFLAAMTDDLLDSEAHLDGDMIGVDVPGHGFEIIKLVHGS